MILNLLFCGLVINFYINITICRRKNIKRKIKIKRLKRKKKSIKLEKGQ